MAKHSIASVATEEALLDLLTKSPSPTFTANSNKLSDEGEKLGLNESRSVSTSTTSNNHDKKVTSSITINLLVLALACSLGFFSFGYQLIVLNGPGAIIETWINQSYVQRGHITIAVLEDDILVVPGVKPATVRLIYSLATGAISAGAIFGSLFAGVVADRIGRRGGQFLCAALTLVAAPLAGISGPAYSPELLMAGRVFFGMSAGMATALAPMYLIEASPQRVRGSMSTVTQLFGCIGLMLAQVLGLPACLGTTQHWTMLFWLAAVAPAVQIFLLFLSPESPRFLYITRGDKLAAIKSLKKLRPRDADLSNELLELEHEAKSLRQIEKVQVRKLFLERKYLWPLSIAVIIHLSQQWCGINGIVGYSSILFENAGVPPELTSYANLSIGVISIVMAVIITALIERLGRRALHLGGLAGMIVFGLLVTLFSILPLYLYSKIQKVYGDASTSHMANMANITCVLTFLIFYNVGPCSIPWMMTSELFGQEARGSATAVCCLINWSSSLVLFVSFPLIQAVLGGYVFMPFVMLLTIFFVFLAKYMPETKGKSFEEISAILERY